MKPKIRKGTGFSAGRWFCGIGDEIHGWGKSPEEAYQSWIKNNAPPTLFLRFAQQKGEGTIKFRRQS